MAIVHEGLVNNATAVGASELHGTQRDVADAQRARIGAAAVGAIPVRLISTGLWAIASSIVDLPPLQKATLLETIAKAKGVVVIVIVVAIHKGASEGTVAQGRPI